MLDKPVLVSAHPEKIIRFLDNFRNRFVVRASAIHQFAFCIKTFTPKTVCAFVFAEVDISCIIDLLQDFLDYPGVGRGCCAYEIVILYVEFRPQGFEKLSDLVHIDKWTQALLLGRSDHLVTMFIGSCQKVGLLAAHPVESIQDIGHNRGVSMTQVRPGIHVIDGGCNVEWFHTFLSSIISSNPTSSSCPSSVLMVISSFNTFRLTTLPHPVLVRTYFPESGNSLLRWQ